MHEVTEHSSVHHFSGNTNILFINKSPRKINRYIIHDLKFICQWIRSNKLSLSAGKTEIIIFKRKHQVITKHLNFRVSGQKINPATSVKYFRVFFKWLSEMEHPSNKSSPKLNREIGLLAKIRHYTPKSIYYSLFNSHRIYTCQIFFRKVQKLL